MNLTRTASRVTNATAIRLDAFELTYASLNEGSARMARLLRAKGLEPADWVGLMLPDVPALAVAYSVFWVRASSSCR